MTTQTNPHDKELMQNGVGKEGHPVANALFALMEARLEEIKLKMLEESDAAELMRLQGAGVELRRWARYHLELKARMAE